MQLLQRYGSRSLWLRSKPHLRLVARKTKCDGVHPACGSCARRHFECNYVHDAGSSNGNGGVKKNRRTSSATASSIPTGKTADESPQSASPPSSRMITTPLTSNTEGQSGPPPSLTPGQEMSDEGVDMKRPLEYPHDTVGRASKKMRLDEASSALPVP